MRARKLANGDVVVTITREDLRRVTSLREMSLDDIDVMIQLTSQFGHIVEKFAKPKRPSKKAAAAWVARKQK
jgi:hypothetical protein